jgi:hypothetical protein
VHCIALHVHVHVHAQSIALSRCCSVNLPPQRRTVASVVCRASWPYYAVVIDSMTQVSNLSILISIFVFGICVSITIVARATNP